ncbi:MAG: di-heme-cytochrome C peroxidase, partial [Gammaproteobacteria bacterium]
AAAPYLHNGSVPTLAELLKPAAERIDSFEIGPAYDVVNIGLAAEQNRFVNDVLKTTDCSDRNSGNSRCGHEFGTQLSAGDKQALLEYLKTL